MPKNSNPEQHFANESYLEQKVKDFLRTKTFKRNHKNCWGGGMVCWQQVRC